MLAIFYMYNRHPLLEKGSSSSSRVRSPIGDQGSTSIKLWGY
jgi:hypothetical protein